MPKKLLGNPSEAAASRVSWNKVSRKGLRKKLGKPTNLQKQLEKKVARYSKLTNAALKKIKILAKDGTPAHKIALDYLSMARNYTSDAKYFAQKGELLNALAAYSYAHAWLDAGVRAKLFDGKHDDKLFTLP